jgi:hypothetical protein
MRTSERAIGCPALTEASAMSDVPIDPFEVLEIQRPRLCLLEFLVGLGFEDGALRLELRNVGRRRNGRLAGRNQEITRVTRLHFDAIADLAEVRNLLQQNDIHDGFPS